jgi:hypothetical protein
MANDVWNLIGMISPIISGFVIYFVYAFSARIEKLEQQMRHYVSEEEVRNILNDNLNPLRDDIRDIKSKIDRLLELYINEQRHR